MSTGLVSRVAAFVRPGPLPRLVSQGRVSCPLSGRDVEVDRCFPCAYYKGMATGDDGATWLRCRVTRTPAW